MDPGTRNVKVRATFPNPDGRLRPGMYASMDVLSPDERQVVVVPVTAVMYAPYGDTVYVIEQQKDAQGHPVQVVRQQFVRLGEKRGDFVSVDQGLSPGQRVVSSGAFKLRNGMAVAVNEKLAPDAQLQPTPPER